MDLEELQEYFDACDTNGDGTIQFKEFVILQSREGHYCFGFLTGAVALAVGDVHSCVLRSSGPPLCWGNNGYGQLGDGSTAQRTDPGAVANLP